MSAKPPKKSRLARIIWICCLAIFLGSVTTIAIFYYSFRDELIGDAVRRVVERTVGYHVSLTGIHLVAPGRVTVERMDLVIGRNVFSSGPSTLEFRIGLIRPLTIKKVTVHKPSISLDISGEGTRDGQRIIERIMEMDIVVQDGQLLLSDKARRYLFRDVDLTYEHGLVGATLAITGSARTEGVTDALSLDGPFQALMRVSGAYPDVSGRGTVSSAGSGYRIGGILFAAERFNARVRFDPDAVVVTDATVCGLSILEEERGLDLEEITATGALKKVTDGPFTLDDVKLSMPRFGEVLLNLTVQQNGQWEVTSEADSLTLSGANLRRLGTYAPDFMAGWGVSGRAKTLLAMGTTDTTDGSITGTLDIELINGGFSSPGSVYLGQGIGGTARILFRDDTRRGLSFDGEFSARDFGLLLSGLFVDFDKRRISGRLSGTLLESGGMKGLTGEVSVPSVFSARVSGDFDYGPSGPTGNLSYSLKSYDLGATFDILFRNFFSNRVGWLYTGTIAGSLDSRGTIAGAFSSPRVSGSVTITDVSLGFPDIDTHVEEIDASMPFSIELSGRPKGAAAPVLAADDFGKLTVSGAVVEGVAVDRVEVLPALVRNKLAFRDELVFSAAGGTVAIGGFAAEDIFDADATIRLSLGIAGVDIAALLPQEKALNLKGSLTGEFSEIGVTDKKLFTSGLLTAKIFSGKVVMENIWGQDIYDAGRRLGCDVTFSDIDLGALTDTVDVGSVTGIAEGRIAGLVISYGGPERFVFDVRTVDKRGVEKRVSVDFVDKLTILGSGSNLFSGVLRSGLNRFVSDYNYSGIGIHLELKNDYFTLRGTIHEGDTEYFIKRSGFTGINVINQNPENRIRFDDMMDRLERINVKNADEIRIETK